MGKHHILAVVAAVLFAVTGCGSEDGKQNETQELSTQHLFMQNENTTELSVPFESTGIADDQDSVTNGSYVATYKLPNEGVFRIDKMDGTRANKFYHIYYDETVSADGHQYGYFGITYAMNTYETDDESMENSLISQYNEHCNDDNYVYPKQECTSEVISGRKVTYFYFSQYYAKDSSYESFEHECTGYIRIADGNYLKITVHVIDKQYQFHYDEAVRIFKNAAEGIISFSPV